VIANKFRAFRATVFVSLFVATGLTSGLTACTGSSKSAAVAPAPTTISASPIPTYKSEIIDTPEGVVTTQVPAPTIADGYSEYESGTTVVAYLLKGESSVAIYENAADTAPAQTIERINGRTLPFVALGHTGKKVRVLLPARPNGSIGWIDETKLELRRNDYRIEINREKFELILFNHNKPVRTIKIGIGNEETPTPKGVYYTLYAAKPTTPDTVFGAFVIGLSGFSEVLSASFNGSGARLGLHGTNKPGLLGSKVSKGCIRMDDVDITYLVKTLPLGTPVQVVA
jgi:lipoprotein-anchoring transpeptidase ErfK/SrfK